MRYFITLSYDGSAFHGWQIQPNAPSVQGCIEHAASTLLGCPVSVTGAGRTDTGVNASGYVAHFDTDNPSLSGAGAEQFRYKLNAMLPKEIVVHSIRETGEDLHARFSATRREYTYFLHTKKDPFTRNHSWLCTFPLDFDKMNQAASLLAGTHDFSCFQKLGSDAKTPICTVYEAFWEQYTPSEKTVMGGDAANDGTQYWYFRVCADRFLRNMVRALVGTLVEVGRGKRSVEDFAKLIRDVQPSSGGAPQTPQPQIPARSLAGESVPGHALFLSAVKY